MNELEVISKVISTLSSNAKRKKRYASELDNFLNRKIQAESNKYRLGVIGVTSSGKSTMINSLLGESLLPAVARPSSSQLVSCSHSTDRSAIVYFQDGKQKIYRGGSLNQKLIERYGDEGTNSKNKEKVKQIELTTPGFPFADSIILIDSPGLDAYGYEGHEQLTMNSLLPTIDFCIFVTTCKTNSDDKMLNVLNTIAEYEKPVIVVQNMIDSIKPSLDGKKSVVDVAQEHRTRVERIVNHSNIKDKSRVHIVQISAINALNARKNGLRAIEDKKLLELSNYNQLVNVVNTAFNQVQPVVEEHRLLFLKKEILRIAKDAKTDGDNKKNIIPIFQYGDTEKQYLEKKDGCIKKLKEQSKKINDLYSWIQNRNDFTENDIFSVKCTVGECEGVISDEMKSLNRTVIYICESLNVDARNISIDFRFDKPALYLKKKKEVVKDGYWKLGKRHWYTLWLKKDDDVWVDTSYTREVTDVNASKQNAKNYIETSIRVFRQTIQRWLKSLEITEQKLFSEITNRKTEYETRKNQILDCQEYKGIESELNEIAESIKICSEKQTEINNGRTDVKTLQKFTIQVNKELLPIYKLSEYIRLKIHNDIFNFFVEGRRHSCVIGWDEYCEERFIRYAFNDVIYPVPLVEGMNVLSDSVVLLHKNFNPTQYKCDFNKDIYILVNATQIGAALSEISRSKVKSFIKCDDGLFFVIQDFNEIINGNSVSETLDNTIGIKQQLGINNANVKYFLLHDNPIYNLAAAEAQAIGCTTQADESKILNDLQKKFRYLIPRNKSSRNFVEATIRIIVQKFGNV